MQAWRGCRTGTSDICPAHTAGLSLTQPTQTFGGGWDALDPLSVAACTFLTYRGSATEFPQIYLGSEADANIVTGCADPAEYTRHVWYESTQNRVWLYAGTAKNDTLFQHAMVSLFDWSRDTTDTSLAQRTWNFELVGQTAILPRRPCPTAATRDCDRATECFLDRTAVATGSPAFEEVYENWYRPTTATWMSASTFASSSHLGGIRLWCYTDKDCGSDELACRQGPETMPGFCFRLSSRPDTDTDVTESLSIIVIVVAAVLAVALLLYTGRRRAKNR